MSGLLTQLLLLWLSLSSALALPLYAQRSGRSCANCHVSPTLEDPEGWDNPELLDRKCTMSCISCHTDPTGGGGRNASGRYYSQSTLAMVHMQDRDYSDHGREVFDNDLLWKVQQLLRKDRPSGDPDGRTIPSVEADAERGMGEPATGSWQAVGDPAGGHHTMAFWDGRYGSLNADPLLQVGGDARLAYWSGSGTFFPMQADLHAAVHPVHRFTVAGTLAARGQTSGFEPQARFFPRRAFLMLHELPGMSWAKAGLFMPSFGTFSADHTLPTRSRFEMDLNGSQDVVAGVELGTAPNYPFAVVSVFANDTSLVTGGEPDTGWGAAVNGGWRDLAWSLTGHAQVRQRGRQGRGDLLAVGVAGGWNPAEYSSLPVTWLGEVTVGQRAVGDLVSFPVAATSETSLRLFNGVVLTQKSDLLHEGTLQHRHGGGLQLTPLPGLSVEGTVRAVLSPGMPVGTDILAQTHLWF